MSTVLTVLLWGVRVIVLDWGLPNHSITDWVEQHNIAKVLIVLTHQDDELLMAGTMAGLVAAGVEVRLITVTDGDGERRRAGQSVEQLIQERAAELNAVGAVMGLTTVEQGFFSDLGFSDVPQEQFDQLLLRKISEYTPDTLLTWDTEKGLYGHKDHVRVARLLVDLCERNRHLPSFSVRAIYSSTVSIWWRELLKLISPMYRDRYYAMSSNESIPPEFSLATRAFADQRRMAFQVYEKRGIVNNLNPFAGLPTLVGDTVFDREYFYQSFQSKR